MGASLAAELVKLRKRPAIWLVAGVWFALNLVFGYLFPYLSYRGVGGPGDTGGVPDDAVLAQALPGGLVEAGVKGLPMFAGALALIIGVLVSGSEYNWQTVKTILTVRPTRSSVLAGKVAALLLVIGAIMLAAFAIDALASVVIAAVEDRSLTDWPGAGDLVKGFASGWLIVAMWAVGGLFLGVLVRGTAMAVGLGLVWALAVENLVRGFANLIGFIDELQRWLPGTNAGSLVAALGAPPVGDPLGTPGVNDVVGGAQAAAVLAAYVVVFAGVAALVFHRRDVT